jgi:hypothetical protein
VFAVFVVDDAFQRTGEEHVDIWARFSSKCVTVRPTPCPVGRRLLVSAADSRAKAHAIGILGWGDREKETSMAVPAWFDDLRRQLAGRGLPPAYVERFVAELSDHLEDLMEEKMSMDSEMISRLGHPEQVAEAAAVAYRQRSYLGRHPMAAFLVFAVSPVVWEVVLFVVVLLTVKVSAAVAYQLGYLSEQGRYVPPSTTALEITQYVFSFFFIVIPSLLVAVLYCRLGRRLGMARGWMWVSCIVVAMMTLLPWWYVRLGADAVGHPRVVGGLSSPVINYEMIQLAVPLLIGWWFLRRRGWLGQRQLAG